MRPALAEDLEVFATETWEEAVSRLHGEKPDMIVVCYAFDEMRPFRLLHYVRHEWQSRKIPIVLLRALPIRLGATQEAQIREAYQSLGVNGFFNLWEEAAVHGIEDALQRFRSSVRRHLSADKTDSG